MPARRATTRPIYRLRNRKPYDQALLNRGSLTLGVDQATLGAWRYEGPTQHGARSRDSDLAIRCVLPLRAVYHLPLRATEGFARSIFGLRGLDLDLDLPDYSTLCGRAENPAITPPKRAVGPLHPVIDSTGLKVYGQGEWKARQPGYSRRRTWLRLHLAIDPATQEIRAAMVSEPGVTDAEAVPDLLEQGEGLLEPVEADGASDRRGAYEALERRGARAIIRPRRDAKIIGHGNPSGPGPARDEDLRRIREIGRSAWKVGSGYHRRSLGETAMFRIETIFGDGIAGRSSGRPAKEVGIGCRAMNIMTHRGMPESERVAV